MFRPSAPCIFTTTLGVLVLLGGLASPGKDIRTLARESSQPLVMGEVIADDEIAARLIEFGQTLMKRKDAVRMKTLVKPLDRPHCALPMAPAGTNQLSAAQLIRQVRRSVLIVGSLYKCSKCKDWHLSAATGFVLSESGAFATCYHVVNQPENSVMVVMTDDGRMFGVREVLAADKAHDVVIVQIENGAGFTPLPITTNAPVGAPVFVVSHPSEYFYTFTSGMVSRYFVSEEDGIKSTMMSITADFGRGSSGCPVFNEFGAVIGTAESIVSTTSTGEKGDVKPSLIFKHARPADALLRLIRKPESEARP